MRSIIGCCPEPSVGWSCRRLRSVRPQSGSAVIMMIGVVALTITMTIASTQVIVLLGQRAKAQTAADAAALAAVTTSRDAAYTVARLNSASVIEYRDYGQAVDVGVRVGRATAQARAIRHVVTPLQQAASGRRTPVRAADWVSP